MKNRAYLLLFISVCLLTMLSSGPAAAKSVLDEKLDMGTLQKMASTGQLIHLEYKGNVLVNRMVCTLVNAPPDKVWAVITDFRNYHRFIPFMQPAKITKISANEYKVDFTLDITIIGPIKTTLKYANEYILEKPYLYQYDPTLPKTAKSEFNYWKIVPVDGGKKTLLFYLEKPPDLAKLGTLVANIVRTKPEIGLGLQVSPISIAVAEVKKYVERKK